MTTSTIFKCNYCSGKFAFQSQLIVHLKKCKLLPRYCPLCGVNVCHKLKCKGEVRNLVVVPWLIENDVNALGVYNSRWSAIQTGVRSNGVRVSQVNIRLPTGELSDAIDIVRRIHTHQREVYKVGLSVGLILKHKETQEYRYFHASQNNAQLTQQHFFITNSIMLERLLISYLVICDVFEEAKRVVSEDTKWKIIAVTNLNIAIYKSSSMFPIGKPPDIPVFMRKRGMLHFQRKPVTKQKYNDNLCVFRCLAKYLYDDCNVATELLRQYDASLDAKTFKGVLLKDFYKLETLFNVQIGVYSISSTGNITVVQTPTKFYAHYGKVNINLYKKHASLIVDFNCYANIYICQKCKLKFKKARYLCQHLKALKPCTKVNFEYLGGVYNNRLTVFEQLEIAGVHIPNSILKVYPYKITYDFEAFFKKATGLNTAKVKVEASHIPLSASVASDFPGFEEPVCFVREKDCDSDNLIERVFLYIQKLAICIGNSVKQLFNLILVTLDGIIKDALNREKQIFDVKMWHIKSHPLVYLKKRLLSWIFQVPVIGFNSGKYDLNLIKNEFHQFLYACENDVQVIKRGNQYLSIATEHMLFLDIFNYLAPGYNYDSYLRAFTENHTKGYFPYEWMTTVRKLKNTTLPLRESFYSSLTKSLISESAYAQCVEVWKKNKMKTFKDFLIYYNNSDVKPFILALNNHAKFFKQRNIDMFKDGITLPGLTLRFLFQKVNLEAPYVLFNKRDKHLHELVQNNLVGGPSIIFHRHHESGVTKIREVDFGKEAKMCRHIIGVDANSLYLKCLAEKHCSGFYIERQKSNNFKPEIRQTSSVVALEWIKYIEYTKQIKLKHQLNGGEVLIGGRKILVDAFHIKTGDIYNFNGCYWHGHDCYLTLKMNVDEKINRKNRTQRVYDYLKALGYKVTVMNECSWLQLKLSFEVAKISKYWIVSKPVYDSKILTEALILKGVVDETIFGLIEVDIVTPESLKDYFKEMTPIFKNIDVTIKDCGIYMNEFIKKHKITKPAQRMLIGSYFGKEILLGTPLLKWYIKHGLKVTKIYRVIQYVPHKTFENFTQEVTIARRMGDFNSESKIISDLYKLLGNSSYGKTITNKKKHTQIIYANDKKTSRLIDSWRFTRATELHSDLYEVEMQLKKIKFNLPLQIGFMVYQYAKLKMLQFTFDFLDKFVSRQDYQLCEMDTDSLYMAISGDSLDAVVKPHLRKDYFKEKPKWIPTDVCDKHFDDYVIAKTNFQQWTPFECCKASLQYNLRTPGLFKIEWEGDGMICLNSKTYMCFSYDDTLIDKKKVCKKWSAKGVVKKQNLLKPDDFLKVLESKQSQIVTNTNFKLINNKMHTYSTTKIGVSYLYLKRKILDDGISTIPLDI